MARKRKRRLKIGRIVAALLIVAALVVAVVFAVKALVPGKGDESSAPSDPSSSSESSSSSQQAVANGSYGAVQMSKDDVHKGDLILVNAEAHYQTDKPNDLVTVASQKTEKYSVKNNELEVREKIMEPFNRMMDDFATETGLTDVMVISAHRTVEYQQMLYENDLKRTGLDYSEEVAKPGESEHHTGLVMDLGIITSDGSKFFDASGDHIWVNQNCYKYGFVVRYPESKKDITKIIHEPWHYRYVGPVHAAVMEEKGFCLEEYIDFLRKYPFEGEHLKTTVDGKDYEIYFVSAGGDTVEVPVPKEKEYTISGNNVDGFIVTAEQ